MSYSMSWMKMAFLQFDIQTGDNIPDRYERIASVRDVFGMGNVVINVRE